MERSGTALFGLARVSGLAWARHGQNSFILPGRILSAPCAFERCPAPLCARRVRTQYTMPTMSAARFTPPSADRRTALGPMSPNHVARPGGARPKSAIRQHTANKTPPSAATAKHASPHPPAAGPAAPSPATATRVAMSFLGLGGGGEAAQPPAADLQQSRAALLEAEMRCMAERTKCDAACRRAKAAEAAVERAAAAASEESAALRCELEGARAAEAKAESEAAALASSLAAARAEAEASQAEALRSAAALAEALEARSRAEEAAGRAVASGVAAARAARETRIQLTSIREQARRRRRGARARRRGAVKTSALPVARRPPLARWQSERELLPQPRGATSKRRAPRRRRSR